MSKYIDAERLCELAKHTQSYNSIVLAAGMCPPVDLAEVVRCEDCIHLDPEDRRCNHGGVQHQLAVSFPMPPNYYCADGERKEE